MTCLAVVLVARAAAQPSADTPGSTTDPSAVSPEGDSTPIIEQPEHDRILLTERAVGGPGKQRLFKVERLPLRGRRLPDPLPRPHEKLVVSLLDNPGEKLEVRWGDIERIDFFEQLVLNDAKRLIDEGKLDDAFRYYQYLDQDSQFREFPGAQDAIARFLFVDAGGLYQARQYEAAWGVLNELYQRNPEFAELPDALGRVTLRLVEVRLTDNDYVGARRLLGGLTERFPNQAVVGELTTRFAGLADEMLAQARQLLSENKLTEAQERATDAVRIWPQSSAARDFLAEQTARYPAVIVGVSALASAEPSAVSNLAQLRSERLLNRGLLELVDYDPEGEGAVYQSPLGTLDRLDLGLLLQFRLNPKILWSDGVAPLTGFDVSRTLSAMADPADPAYQGDWGELLAQVSVENVFDVRVALRRSHVRPDAMLLVAPRPWNSPGERSGPHPTLGPYVLASTTAQESRYVANPRYFAAGATQPKEVIERRFDRGADSLRALELGQVAVIDRLNPWEIEHARKLPGVVVENYAAPTVHCLAPSPKSALCADRTFRRALVYGLHREGILAKRLLRGQEIQGCQVVSGPFPRGYAYDARVEVRPYDPRLALTLATIIQLQKQKAAKKPPAGSSEVAGVPGDSTSGAEGQARPENAPPDEGQAPSTSAPQPTPAKLVLAHPASEVARVACEEIERQLRMLKLEVERVELPPGVVTPAPETYDLLYVELTMLDPIVDARRWLGSEAPVGVGNVYLDLALRQLEQANDWKSARERLFRIHELAADELPVIPLWQLVDHFAHRTGIERVGARPVRLYQNIEQWRLTPWIPADVK